MRALTESFDNFGVLIEDAPDDIDYPYFHVSDHPETPSINEKPAFNYNDPFGIFLFLKGQHVDVAQWSCKRYRWDAKIKNVKLWVIDSMGQTEAWQLLNKSGIKTPLDAFNALKQARGSEDIIEFEFMGDQCGDPADLGLFEKQFWSDYFTNGYAASAAFRILRSHFHDRGKLTQFLKAQGYHGVYDTTGAVYAGEPQVIVFDAKDLIFGPREENTPDNEVYRLNKRQ